MEKKMKKTVLILLFVSFLLFCISAQTTKVHITAKNDISIYRVEKENAIVGKNFFSTNEYEFERLILCGNTPLDIDLPNGKYTFSFDGFNDFNDQFSLNANGETINIDIVGDYEKTKIANIWANIFACTFTLSIGSMAGISKIDPDNPYIGFVLPVVLGCGFCISYGNYLSIKPKAIMF
jgi:hypothetical protein